MTHFNGGVVKSYRKEGFVIDERGKLKRFNKKKLSRRRCKDILMMLCNILDDNE